MKPDVPGPRERILESAFDLFRDRGYAETGLAEILSRAGAYKKSLYDHFHSKEDLALQYLLFLQERHGGWIERVAESSRNLDDFLKRWTALVRRSLKQSGRQDCPVGLFAGQVVGQAPLRPVVGAVIEALVDALAKALQRFEPIPGVEARRRARSAFLVFQGGMRLYHLTGEEAYLSLMDEELKRIGRGG